MIQELIYTSVPHGLKPDSSGFCTVACTEGMATNLQSELERLSGYRHFADPNAKLTPHALMHTIRRVGGAEFHILSRVANCAEDYTGRTNKIAHHLALDARELQQCGPAAILLADENQSIFRKEWNAAPDTIKIAKRLPNVNYTPQKCVLWEHVFGDAGYAGLAAQAAEDGRPISLIFRPDMQVLPIQLIAEALSLLPPSVRWNVSFSSYFLKTQENDKSKIQWKCILAQSEEMAVSRLTSKTLFMDLANLMDFKARNPLAGKYVDDARGNRISTKVASPAAMPKTAAPVVAEPIQMADINDVPYDMDERNIIPPTTGVPKRKRGPVYMKPRETSYRVVAITGILLLLVLTIIGAMFVMNNGRKGTPVANSSRNEAPRNDGTTLDTGDDGTTTEPPATTVTGNDGTTTKTGDDNTTVQEATLATEPTVTGNDDTTTETTATVADNNTTEREALAKAAIAALDALPSKHWRDSGDRGIVMRQDGNNLTKNIPVSTLKDSDALRDHKNLITLDIIPYFQEKDADGKRLGEIYVVEQKDKHNITFCVDKQKELIPGESTSETIATIAITDEGIKFQWTGISSPPTEDVQNRALLSVLKISVGEYSKEIPLYEPIVQIAGTTDPLPKLNDAYYIWTRQRGDRKVFVRKEKETLILEFGTLDGNYGELKGTAKMPPFTAKPSSSTIAFTDSAQKEKDVEATLHLESMGEDTEKIKITATFEERDRLPETIKKKIKDLLGDILGNSPWDEKSDVLSQLRKKAAYYDDVLERKPAKLLNNKDIDKQEHDRLVEMDKKEKDKDGKHIGIQAEKNKINETITEIEKVLTDADSRLKVINGIETSLKTKPLPLKIYLQHPTDKSRKLLLLESTLNKPSDS